MFLTAAHLRAARAMLDMTQADVAGLAEVSLPTLKRLESQASGPQKANSTSVEAVARVYTEGGVRFLFEEGDAGVGVRLAKL
jgi:predicted transcriptional regulator